MTPAVIIVDMLEDGFIGDRDPLRPEVRLIEPMRDFLKECRSRSVAVIFACDSFLESDFIFRGRMKPHALRGTAGSEVLSSLLPAATDIVLQKRRFSAFFKTDLDQTLRTLGIDTVAVGGINTHFCVLATALDALAHDFNTIFLEDMCAAYKQDIHENCLNGYRKSAVYPLMRVMSSAEFLFGL
jgi:nicotinamidase/pyrazinamidase